MSIERKISNQADFRCRHQYSRSMIQAPDGDDPRMPAISPAKARGDLAKALSSIARNPFATVHGEYGITSDDTEERTSRSVAAIALVIKRVSHDIIG